VGRAARDGRRAVPGAHELSDIFAGQPAEEALLAEIYDLEHDEITEDLVFYREQARQFDGPVIDLGCGSGRLFAPLLGSSGRGLVGVDGSAALLERAADRIDADETLRAARDGGRLELVIGDVRTVRRRDRFGLAIMAGVLAHLDGPEDGLRAFDAVRALLAPDGVLIVDNLGPGALPPHDLPLSIDWERDLGDRRVVRRSSLVRRTTPEGLRVEYSTLTDLVGADGTIARLPAGFRLWYPSVHALIGLADEARLAVDVTFGSHDLDPLGERSERCILVLRPVPGSRRE
jgi:SAM-dependent methyltransferase